MGSHLLYVIRTNNKAGIPNQGRIHSPFPQDCNFNTRQGIAIRDWKTQTENIDLLADEVIPTRSKCQHGTDAKSCITHNGDDLHDAFITEYNVSLHNTSYYLELEMWANAQRDGRPAKYRWHPLFNAAQFA